MSEVAMVGGVAVDPETGEVLDPADPVEESIASEMGADETPDPETDEETDEETETEPDHEPEGLSDREMGKKFDSLGKRAATFRGYVATFAEETSQPLVTCPLCLDFAPGYIFHPDVQRPGETNLNETKALLGLPIERPLLPDPKSNTCPVCDGWGDVLTGSKKPEKNVVTCLECDGRGWVGERLNRTPQEIAAGLPAPARELGLAEDERPMEDSWGTPLGHDDYGRSPQFRKPGWQEQLEAYKRGFPAPLPDPITVGG